MYRELLRTCYNTAFNESDDPSTRNCAIIVNRDLEVVAHGVNRFPAGIAVTPDRLVREAKYRLILHAEQDAIIQAAKHGCSIRGLRMICPWAACDSCARMIIQAGINHVVVHSEAMARTPQRWHETISFANEMLAEAGVHVEQFAGSIGDCDAICDGIRWKP